MLGSFVNTALFAKKYVKVRQTATSLEASLLRSAQLLVDGAFAPLSTVSAFFHKGWGDRHTL